MNYQPNLTFAGQSLDKVLQWTAAELKIAVVAAASNTPLAFHDKLSPTMRNICTFQACLKVPLSINKSYLRMHAEWCYSTNTEGRVAY